MFMSPSVGRKNGHRNKAQDDESRLILASPTSSDGEHNSIINGNDWHNPPSSGPEVGFAFPNVKIKTPIKTPVSQVRRIFGNL